MTPIKKGKYEFKPSSIIEIRKTMGLSQTKMAQLLEIPQNTLSRWEIGATVPDAKFLAAIYSVAKENGITPMFFERRKSVGEIKKQLNDRLIVIWDFQTLGLSPFYVAEGIKLIETEMDKRFGEIPDHIFKAFTHPSQNVASQAFTKSGWGVWEGESDIVEDIIHQAKSDTGHNPKGTILILITEDDCFIDLVKDLVDKGVKVYVISPPSYNNKLVENIGKMRWIEWNPPSRDYSRRNRFMHF